MAVGGEDEGAIRKNLHSGIGAVPVFFIVHQADAELAFTALHDILIRSDPGDPIALSGRFLGGVPEGNEQSAIECVFSCVSVSGQGSRKFPGGSPCLIYCGAAPLTLQTPMMPKQSKVDLNMDVFYNKQVIYRNFKISRKEKSRIYLILERILSEKNEVLFAFFYGSFNDISDNLPFHDIDIGIYTKGMDPKSAVYYSLELSQELTKSTSLPVDVRVINSAPIPFLFHVIQGKPIVSKDDDALSSFMEHVMRRYLDMKPLLHTATKEALLSNTN